jgi:hypothetical protein
MDRLIGTLAILVLIAALLPAVAQLVQGAIPALVGLLVVLALLRAWMPGSRGGHR